jgi:hypothetical protein
VALPPTPRPQACQKKILASHSRYSWKGELMMIGAAITIERMASAMTRGRGGD